jgi:hypothetical protein
MPQGGVYIDEKGPRRRRLRPAFELDGPHDPILLRDDQTVRRSEVFGETRIAGEGGLALFHIGQVLDPHR